MLTKKVVLLLFMRKLIKESLENNYLLKRIDLVNNEVSLNGVHPKKKIIDLKAGDLMIFDHL